LNELSSSFDSRFDSLSSTMNSGFKDVVQAIKSQSAPTPTLGGLNWNPVIQGLVSGLASSLGASVNFPSSANASAEIPVVPSTQSTQSDNNLTSLYELLE
jgi:hypothetical protein